MRFGTLCQACDVQCCARYVIRVRFCACVNVVAGFDVVADVCSRSS